MLVMVHNQQPDVRYGWKADGVDGSRSRHLSAKVWKLSERPRAKGATHMEISTVGLDLAKSIFQIHAVDATGKIVVRKALRRALVSPFFAKLPPCLIGIEACGTSHHWARELAKLGHEVRLMPPAYVKPYVKRGKTDAADAEAICEAVTRPSMRFVPVKSAEQQAALALHRTRDLLVKQRTQLVNMVRGLLAEFGIETARGLHHALALAARLSAGDAPEVPALAQRVVKGLADQIGALQVQLGALEKELLAWHRSNELSQRLATIPGLGVISATALAASVSEPARFRSGRQFAASLGLTPLQNCSGGKERMGRISRMGDRYLRRLLVVGMTSLVRRARAKPDSVDPRFVAMLQRKPARVVTVAAANRTARVAWAIMTRGGTYQTPVAVAA
jgi:transposase